MIVLGATILYDDYTPLSNLNKGLGSIINQGYKLINITNPSPHEGLLIRMGED